MKIIGHGIDLVSIARIRALLQQPNGDFRDAVFTDREVLLAARAANQIHFFAGRFAAKEATLKAFGTGFTQGIGLREIEIVSEDSGRPQVTLKETAASVSQKLGIGRLLLSISHDRDYAIASVVATGD